MASLEAMATCSMRSIRRLKVGLAVSIPPFRNEIPSLSSRRKRDAIRSYLERSRSMTL